MSAAGKEDDAGKAQAEEVMSQILENPNEDVVVSKEDIKVGDGETKKLNQDINVTATTRKIEEDSFSSSNDAVESEGFSDAQGGESFLEFGFLSDMKSYEKKALIDLRSKLEDAILKNTSENSKEETSLEVEKQKAAVEYQGVFADKEVSVWGVPLLPSKGDQRTDVVLLKFIRAREFRAADAFEMLKSCLEWRKANKVDSIMEEDFGDEFDRAAYMKGTDREGHPVCYNVYGVFGNNEELYNKTFGSEAGRERFLRWRLQLLEKEILKLDFGPGGVSTLLQVNDLKDAPGPSRRDLRLATKRALAILQDNYPEFVDKNIFVNVPFWYYAFNAVLSAFLTQRTKSKFVFSRPSRVTDTLVKYIAAEEIPAAYGGLRREDDPEFSTKDAASEIIVKAGATETIEIPSPEVGNSLMWEVMIVGWDVNYKEEFVPTDEASYTVIVKKERRINWQQESIRNTFKNKEVGKLVITIENGMFKKKRLLYRYKINN